MRGYYRTVDSVIINAHKNCFQIGGLPVDTGSIKDDMIWAYVSHMNLDFSQNACVMKPMVDCEFYVIYNGGFAFDTVWTDCQGFGGGSNSESSINLNISPK